LEENIEDMTKLHQEALQDKDKELEAQVNIMQSKINSLERAMDDLKNHHEEILRNTINSKDNEISAKEHAM
jgi:hypothetical protein